MLQPTAMYRRVREGSIAFHIDSENYYSEYNSNIHWRPRDKNSTSLIHISALLRGSLKHSTVQQLLLFTNNLYESFSAKAHSDVIYLDFKKAFDSVAHAELMMKLWTFGITQFLSEIIIITQLINIHLAPQQSFL